MTKQPQDIPEGMRKPEPPPAPPEKAARAFREVHPLLPRPKIITCPSCAGNGMALDKWTNEHHLTQACGYCGGTGRVVEQVTHTKMNGVRAGETCG